MWMSLLCVCNEWIIIIIIKQKNTQKKEGNNMKIAKKYINYLTNSNVFIAVGLNRVYYHVIRWFSVIA